jgi:hypothetical protein
MFYLQQISKVGDLWRTRAKALQMPVVSSQHCNPICNKVSYSADWSFWPRTNPNSLNDRSATIRDTAPLLEYFVEDVIMEGNFLHLVRCDVIINITVFLYVTQCCLVEQHQHFTETFASIRAEDEGKGFICNGASLPDFSVLQPTRQWSSLIFLLNVKSLEFPENDHMPILHHLEWHFFTVACEHVHYLKW